MRNAHCGTWNMAKSLENEMQCETHTIGQEIWLETLRKVENDTEKLFDLEYGEKTEKRGKGETHTLGPRIWRKNEKHEK